MIHKAVRGYQWKDVLRIRVAMMKHEQIGARLMRVTLLLSVLPIISDVEVSKGASC
jgi:hypothetical protein